jgi:dGTPase
VSSVARGLGSAIARWLREQNEISPDAERGVEAITATCGLIHDLGNPPFGHSGEGAIQEWFAKHFDGKASSKGFQGNPQLICDFSKFEGNAQTLRLITKLQILADFNGLNFTYGTLSTACKYVATSHETERGEHVRSKPGFFASENKTVEDIRDRTGTGPHRHPLTFLVEAADDIVYSVADLEDAVRKSIFGWREIEPDLKSADSEVVAGMNRILQLTDGSDRTDLRDEHFASAFRTSAIGIMVKSVVEEFKNCYDQIMTGQHTTELVSTCDRTQLISTLKRLGRTRIYCTPSNLKLELMGRRIIQDLMTVFWEGAREMPLGQKPKTNGFAGKIGALFSENYRRVFQHSAGTANHLPEAYHRYQLVTDYICGMTDTFAKRLHSELTNG